MALAKTPAVAPKIELDPDYANTKDQGDDYQSRRKYWYQLRPGDYLIPLLALAPHHPLLNGGPIEPQTPSSSSSSYHRAGGYGGASATSDSASQEAQHDPRLIPSPTNPARPLESSVAVPPPASDPPPDRQLCEVWPISYRSADGWLKTCWCIQIDGEPSYQYRPPDFHALAMRYHLVYPPPFTALSPAAATDG